MYLEHLQGGLSHDLYCARWDSALTLNTDSMFQTDASNPLPEHPSLDGRARFLALNDTVSWSRPSGNWLGIPRFDKQALFL